jgi:hypothetical protein
LRKKKICRRSRKQGGVHGLSSLPHVILYFMRIKNVGVDEILMKQNQEKLEKGRWH